MLDKAEYKPGGGVPQVPTEAELAEAKDAEADLRYVARRREVVEQPIDHAEIVAAVGAESTLPRGKSSAIS